MEKSKEKLSINKEQFFTEFMRSKEGRSWITNSNHSYERLKLLWFKFANEPNNRLGYNVNGNTLRSPSLTNIPKGKYKEICVKNDIRPQLSGLYDDLNGWGLMYHELYSELGLYLHKLDNTRWEKVGIVDFKSVSRSVFSVDVKRLSFYYGNVYSMNNGGIFIIRKRSKENLILYRHTHKGNVGYSLFDTSHDPVDTVLTGDGNTISIIKDRKKTIVKLTDFEGYNSQ